MLGVLAFLVVGMTTCKIVGANEAISTGVALDSTNVLGPDACTKCHGPELQAWRQTPHFATFDALHRQPAAKEIAQKLGIRSIKRNDLCIGCHYTPQGPAGDAKPIAGVSCEMCHGASREWIAIHNDYGGLEKTRQTESDEHRMERVENSIRLGMRNPANIYLIARGCFQCHTVPREDLVNIGGHTAGSGDFELVAWSQGKVRHNFLRTDYASNAISDQPRLRVMFVVGMMTDLEFSLRATAQATLKDTFGVTSAVRAYNVRRKLADLQEKLRDPRIDRALVAAYGVKLKSNNRADLEAAAKEVGQAAYEFADQVDGSELSGLDALLPKEADYR